MMRYVITLLLLGGAAGSLAVSLRRNPDQLAQPLESIQSEIAGWKHVATQPLGPNVLRRLSPTDYLARTYRNNGHDLNLFIAYYAQQRAGESMHSPKNCLPGAGWEIWKYDSAYIPVGNGEDVQVNKYYVHNGGKRVLVYYWYQSRQRIVASEYVGKLLLVRDAIVNGQTAGSLVRIVVDDLPEAAAQARAFAAAIIPEVDRCFRR